MGVKSHHLACPGLSAREEHLLTKAWTRPKRREARSRTPRKHLKNKNNNKLVY